MSTVQFPSQQRSYSNKGDKWRKQCIDWAVSKTYFNFSPVRRSTHQMKINQDLVNGVIHMDDIQRLLNPSDIKSSFIPDSIQHFPIMNSKLNVLQGEEARRGFFWRVVVTNPTCISEIEQKKKELLLKSLRSEIEDISTSEEEFKKRIDALSYHYLYEWQDWRESRASALLNHYFKEQNFANLFNTGFMDAMKFGEEIYSISIVGGEPVLEKLNPMNVHVFRSGYSNRIEDADMIVIEDFWSPGRIIDTYYDVLSADDIKKIEELSSRSADGDLSDYEDREAYVHKDWVLGENNDEFYSSLLTGGNYVQNVFMPYDTLGNVRVVRVFWKSKRKIKKVKSYDQYGDINYTFFPETYKLKDALGEEETIHWINEAWEGVLIGKDIYVNMRPCPVQYNRLSNPSRCHFGIIGSVYNKNDDRPFSLVDMMKPYSYYYDVIHDRLNKLIEKNWGKIIELDLSKVPKGWKIDKWLYYVKVNNLAVIDSFKEGNQGMAMGKLAGAFGNSNHVIDAEFGQSIQQYLNILEYIKSEMGEVAGINRQREGQVYNRETVGGVERATLQSAFSTEWLFTIHNNLKKRVLEAFLETSKIALKGRKKKFQYLLDDGQQKIMEIEGDEYAESDYGILIDDSEDTQMLNQNMNMLTQAAIQNQYKLSSVMKLFMSSSLSEKAKMLEFEEKKREEQTQGMQQQQMQMQQQQMQQSLELEKAKMEQEYKISQESNKTKIEVANINSKAEADRLAIKYGQDLAQLTEVDAAKLDEEARQFDMQMELKRQELELKRAALEAQKEQKYNKDIE